MIPNTPDLEPMRPYDPVLDPTPYEPITLPIEVCGVEGEEVAAWDPYQNYPIELP